MTTPTTIIAATVKLRDMVEIYISRAQLKPSRFLHPMTLIRVLAATAIVITSYLLFGALRDGHVVGCGPASGCDDVLNSRWGYWMGLPVSLPALFVYASLLAATFSDRARALSAWAACIVLAAAAWFLGLQLLVIRHLCPYCLAAHLTAGAAAILVLKTTGNALRRSMPRNAALLGAAVLLTGAWVNQPSAHRVHAGSASVLSPASRQLDIFGGMFKIAVGEVPLIGRRDAPAVMVSLLDYTCRHCRKMHDVLLDAERAHRGKLAIATLPMPLDAACNKTVPATAPPHVNACQYARLALAVWRADPSKMDRFNEWVFEPEVPPSLGSVLGYAQEIVGEEALGRAMNDPWVQKQLAQDIAIYEAASTRFNNPAMPQLVVGDNIVFGELENGPQDLETLLLDILN